MNNPSDSMRNQTHGLLACGALLPPTVAPCTPISRGEEKKCVLMCNACRIKVNGMPYMNVIFLESSWFALSFDSLIQLPVFFRISFHLLIEGVLCIM
jgi:hypothetical protein